MSSPARGLLFAKGDSEVHLLPRMANRHGLIAGATGTGKTVTLQTLAHEFSRLGVPVFLSDVKGDLTGLARPGSRDNKKVAQRLDLLGLSDFSFDACPVSFWDVFGEQGNPMRATISEMGPLLLSRLLGLNETQAGVMSVAFKFADDEGLLLLDLKDLRELIRFVGENAKTLRTIYGQIAPSSVGAIQRSLLNFEQQGGEKLFGEPALDLADLMRIDPTTGHGFVNILSADKLLNAPSVYSSFLLWLLSELWENLPEVGDLDKPKLIFFFDEAHLLFNDSPKPLLDKVEQVVRLIRSKGVGVYFVTQNPIDVPDTVLGQLGNRVQHALRAFSPRDRKAVKTAAETFRPNPSLNTEQVITELGIGEALISVLDDRGMPTPVERAFVLPPPSHIGPISDEERDGHIQLSPFQVKYGTPLDRVSAYEVLRHRAETHLSETEGEPGPRSSTGSDRPIAPYVLPEPSRRDPAEAQSDAERRARLNEIFERDRYNRMAKESQKTPKPPAAKKGPDTPIEAFTKNAARSFGTSFGRAISRSIFGIFGIGESNSRLKPPPPRSRKR